MRVYLRTKFQGSSIILTSFRQGEGGGRREILPAPPPAPSNTSKHTKRTPKTPTQIRVKLGDEEKELR